MSWGFSQFFVALALLAPAAVRARDRGGPLGVTADSLGSCARFGSRAVCWGNGYNPLFGASVADTSQPIGDDADEIVNQPEMQWQTSDRLSYIQTEYRHRCALFANGGVRCMSREGNLCGRAMNSLPFAQLGQQREG
jgi:hypothetical protein